MTSKSKPFFQEFLKKDCFQKDLSAKVYLCLLVLIVLAKIALGSLQMTYIWVGGAPIDDELMFQTAQSITAGQWLGEYTWLTLSKQMFFALWLALCNLLHLPYLVAGQMLLCAAAFAMMRAFVPVLRSYKMELLLFAALCFNPAASASFTLRVYRDNIFPSICLLFFAGMIGAALRYKRARRVYRPWLFLAGLGLGLAMITREDGIWLMPFALVATAMTILFICKEKGVHRKLRRCLTQLTPYWVAAGIVLIICCFNYANYGIFATSDFSQGSFTAAYGAMTRVATDETQENSSLVPVPESVRLQLYEAVPEFALLQEALETDEAGVRGGYYNAELGDYQAGAFYWVLRKAASNIGVYQDAQTAQDYWQSVADGINTAIDEGVLTATVGERNSTTPIITAEHILPTLGETVTSFFYCITFQDTSVYYQTERSIASAQDAAIWADYLGSKSNDAAVAGLEIPYYSPWQMICYTCFNLLRYLYAAALPVLFVLACYGQCKKAIVICKQGREKQSVPAIEWLLCWVLFGLLGMALLRCAMIAFMEVAAFQIGTYVMYLATVHPLLITFAVVGVCSGARYTKANEKQINL